MRGIRFAAFFIVFGLAFYALGGDAATPAAAQGKEVRKPKQRQANSRQITRKMKRPACRDRRDNDGDGLTDFPSDPGCKNRRDRTERNSSGDLGEGVSLGGRRPFPDDNPWNQDISGLPVDPNSDALIESIGLNTGLHPDFGTIWEGAPIGIPYVVVTGAQAKVPVSFYYEDESDAGPYPIPADPPIEGGPESDGDRHILIIDRDNWKLYELFDARKVGGAWQAGSGAIFNLSSNDLRPAGWTSADAAGLPIFPGLVRYDEVFEQGEIKHALRFTASRTRRAYVYPARHFASSNTSSDLPPMGMRVRLKSDFDISPFPAPLQVILTALKKYGMFLADNGSNWYISGAPDSRWDDDLLSTIRGVKGRDFEVVEMGEIVTN
ncbi:MAG: hypothetical protein DCC75_00945 [Proteobacteria bacterium]|nr:MAG: hypothetical protein DCC75_00945 [Pseudomonadota bacterium]